MIERAEPIFVGLPGKGYPEAEEILATIRQRIPYAEVHEAFVQMPEIHGDGNRYWHTHSTFVIYDGAALERQTHDALSALDQFEDVSPRERIQVWLHNRRPTTIFPE